MKFKSFSRILSEEDKELIKSSEIGYEKWKKDPNKKMLYKGGWTVIFLVNVLWLSLTLFGFTGELLEYYNQNNNFMFYGTILFIFAVPILCVILLIVAYINYRRYSTY